jgi:broad specificity phosphatase PhoE
LRPDSLVLIRAGVTDYEVQGRIRGSLDVPLCEAGEAQAAAAAALLAETPPAALYTAESLCAVETGRIIGRQLGLKPRVIPGLHNLDQGLWQGLLVEDIRRRQPRLYRQWQDNPWAVAPPEGELLEEACERVEAALEKLLRRHGEGRVAVVVPDPLDRIFGWILAGESMGDLWTSDWTQDPRGGLVRELSIAAQWAASDSGRPAAPGRRQASPT